MIAGQYDEFFFDAEAGSNSVINKNYVGTLEGQGFLGNPENPKVGVVYDVGNGKRIVYQPNETHPWNHFSKTSTGHAIDFYDMAFADYSELVTIGDDGQTWMFKEWFSFVALIGFFMFFIPVISLLGKLPFLKNIYTTKPDALPQPKTMGSKASSYILLILGGLFPALLFSAWYSGDVSGMRLLTQVSIILIVTSAIVLVYSLIKNADKNLKLWSIIMLVLSAVQFWYLKGQDKFLATTEYFGAPTANPISYWAINVAIIMLMLMVSYHYFSKKPEGATIANYGVKVNVKTIIAALVTAIVAIVIGYIILFSVDAVFKTDFRLWTFAVKTFENQHVIALLKYAPLFFIYYFVVGISVNVNTASEKYNGIKGYIVAILHFIGGLLLYLAYHYGLLFTTGTAGYPAEALSSIVVIGLIPVLTIAAIFNRYFYRKTGNIYVGAFLNTLLMTMITLANTTIYTIF